MITSPKLKDELLLSTLFDGFNINDISSLIKDTPYVLSYKTANNGIYYDLELSLGGVIKRIQLGDMIIKIDNTILIFAYPQTKIFKETD